MEKKRKVKNDQNRKEKEKKKKEKHREGRETVEKRIEKISCTPTLKGRVSNKTEYEQKERRL